jgi:nucleotide-binding universal stress UspA family protein
MISALVNIAPDEGHESRLQAAIALVRARGGHITCVQMMSDIPATTDPGDPTTEAEMLIEMEDVAREFQRSVEAALEGSGVGWTWLRFYGDPATILIERSRFADVIVMSTDSSFPPISSVALHTRTPFLAVPHNPNFIPGRSALIAWNGSAPAANAVHGAMPLFDDRQPVHVLCVDHEDQRFPASLVQQYLLEHHIESDIHWRPSDGKAVAEAIVERAGEMESGIIVAGAFGHNHLREMLLGSVTRQLMEKSSRPLFLSH